MVNMVEKSKFIVTKEVNRSIEKKYTKRKWYHIDRSTLVAKLTNFLHGAKSSAVEPYLILFYLSIGLNPFEAGLVGGFRLFGMIMGGVFWGFVADYKKQYRLTIAIVCIGSIIAMGLQPLLSVWFGDKKRNMCPPRADNTNATLFNGSTRLTNEAFRWMSRSSKNSSTSRLFYAMLFINIISKFFEGSHVGFIDSGTIEQCRTLPHNPSYGNQRMFGAVGFASGIIVSNIFVDNFPKLPVSCYTAIFITFGILTFVLLLGLLIQYDGLTFETKNVQSKNRNICATLKRTINLDACIFFFTVLIMGAEQSFYTNFVFVLLQEMNAPTLINGITIAVADVTCIVSFYLGSRIIKKMGGTWNTILMCCFTYFVRYITMAYVTNPWLIPLVQTFQSTCFGLFLFAAVLHVENAAPPEVLTTMYSVMNTIHFGVGYFLANIMAGKVIEQYDSRTLFKMASVIAIVWSVVLAVYLTSLRRWKIARKLITEEIKMVNKDPKGAEVKMTENTY